jgi:hypothetical protein
MACRSKIEYRNQAITRVSTSISTDPVGYHAFQEKPLAYSKEVFNPCMGRAEQAHQRQ